MIRHIQITDDLDIVSARVEGRDLARELGFGVIDQARIATAISELARNVVLYAHSGEIVLSQVSPDGRVGLQIVCRDHGPGIQNVEEVMNRSSAASGQGASEATSARGLESTEAHSAESLSGGNGAGDGPLAEAKLLSGRGLAGTRRLMDEFQITSEVGVGTTVKTCRWLRQGAGSDGQSRHHHAYEDELGALGDSAAEADADPLGLTLTGTDLEYSGKPTHDELGTE